MRAIFVVGGVVAAVALCGAQSYRADVDLVRIFVTVVDRAGQPVTGLSAKGFTVKEDGAASPVVSFGEQRVPVSIVVALDSSLSMDGPRFKRASLAVQVLAEALRPNDELGAIGFYAVPFLIAPPSTDVRRVLDALPNVKPTVGGTALYGGVEMALDYAAEAHNDKRAVVVISDGNDSVTKRDLLAIREQQSINRIKHGDTLVYGIAINARAENGRDPAALFSPFALSRLADPSGGWSQTVSVAAEIPDAAVNIRDALDHQYLLGIEPKHRGDNKYHRLNVSVSTCKCQVRAREGYFAAR
ncbi:MAG: VWA domain-containing protein [Acidobacteriaceae bacterium]|jgi:VWFA-related protein|nr:VWA domain-containing protein [Acidobacteriaceae bacterium]